MTSTPTRRRHDLTPSLGEPPSQTGQGASPAAPLNLVSNLAQPAAAALEGNTGSAGAAVPPLPTVPAEHDGAHAWKQIGAVDEHEGD